MRKIKGLTIAALMTVLVIVSAVPVMAAPAIDSTLAVPPVFASSQYAALNPGVFAECGGDMLKMYNHYLTQGVRNGERIYATPAPTATEALFLYMSYNRQNYIKNGMSANYPYFNVNNYVALNPDLVKTYGANMPMYMYHYVNYGVYEGRQNGTLTDPAKVIAWNPGIAELDNGKMSPTKIISNYTAATGQPTTAILSNPPKPAPVQTVYYYSSSKHEHDWKYESIDDEKHWKECKDCDEKEKEDHHYHVYSTTNGTDTSKHVLKCSKCDHKWAQAHYDKNGDGKCDKCDYVMVPAHVHTYGNWAWVDGTTTHKHTCTVSGCTVSETANCDHTAGGTCSGCGHVYTAPAHAHSFGMGTWNSGTTTHTKTCTAAGCTTPPYSFTENCDHADGSGDGNCTGCGHHYDVPTSGGNNSGTSNTGGNGEGTSNSSGNGE